MQLDQRKFSRESQDQRPWLIIMSPHSIVELAVLAPILNQYISKCRNQAMEKKMLRQCPSSKLESLYFYTKCNFIISLPTVKKSWLAFSGQPWIGTEGLERLRFLIKTDDQLPWPRTNLGVLGSVSSSVGNWSELGLLQAYTYME